MQYLDAISKTTKWSLFVSKANHSISRGKFMPRAVMLKKLKLTVLWRPTRPSGTNSQTRCPFHYRGLECKSRKSRATWRNRQIWPWSANRSRAKANRVFCFVFNLLGPLLIVRFLKWNVTSWFCHQPAKLRVTPLPRAFSHRGPSPQVVQLPNLVSGHSSWFTVLCELPSSQQPQWVVVWSDERTSLAHLD